MMTVLIAVAIWLGGGFLLALFLGALLSFSERNEADELQMISSWQMSRGGSQEAKGVPVVGADQVARPQTAAYAPMGTLVSPAPFAGLHLSPSDRQVGAERLAQRFTPVERMHMLPQHRGVSPCANPQ
jgi:hypothetical protein